MYTEILSSTSSVDIIIIIIIISNRTFGPLAELCITFGYDIVVRHGLCSLLCLVSQFSQFLSQSVSGQSGQKCH